MSGILEGVRVIDMTVAIAMPAGTAMMADWGAEVIKVEPLFMTGELVIPPTPPPWSIEERGGAVYMTGDTVNRNKKGIAIDLKQEKGQQILHKLVEKADVFASNYEQITVNKLKADYGTLSKVNPRIIYCLLSAYGTKGPDKDLRGGDYTAAWARSGAQHQMGEPGSPPAMNLWGALDRTAGTYAAAGILAALWNREKTGKGEEVEVSLYHTGIWTYASDIQMALLGMTPPKYERSKGVTLNPMWTYYRTKDNRCLQFQPFGINWPQFCQAIERPDFETDPRFHGGSMDQMRKNAEELISLLDEVFATKTLEEWEKRLREYNIIHGRVATPMEVTQDPQAIANDFFAEVDHPALGKTKLVTTPVQFQEHTTEVKSAAPVRGQDTEEVLLEIGYEWEDIGQFKEEGVIL